MLKFTPLVSTLALIAFAVPASADTTTIVDSAQDVSVTSKNAFTQDEVKSVDIRRARFAFGENFKVIIRTHGAFENPTTVGALLTTKSEALYVGVNTKNQRFRIYDYNRDVFRPCKNATVSILARGAKFRVPEKCLSRVQGPVRLVAQTLLSKPEAQSAQDYTREKKLSSSF